MNTPDPQSSSFSNQPNAGFMGLAEVLQVFSQAQRSGQVTYAAGDNYGHVYLQHGQIIHATLNQIEGEDAIFVMLEWQNGTFTFDEGILPHRRSVVNSLEQLLLEGARRSDLGNLPKPNPSNAANLTTPTGVTQVASSRIQGGQPRLCIYNGGVLAQSYEITQEYTRVGRIAGNDIVLPDPSVSSRHCILIRSGDDILVRDLNSSNGTLINKERITEKMLMLGDTLMVGSVPLLFESSIRRPKLTSNAASDSPRPTAAAYASPSTSAPPTPSGSRAIVYQDIAPPAKPKAKTSPLVIILGLFAVILVGMAVYFLVFK